MDCRDCGRKYCLERSRQYQCKDFKERTLPAATGKGPKPITHTQYMGEEEKNQDGKGNNRTRKRDKEGI